MKALLGTLFVAGVLVAAPVSLAATASDAATPPSDKTLDDRAEARIHKDGRLRKYDIDVSAEKGVVILRGVVPTHEDSVRATRLASVDGATRVDNRLVIDLSGGAIKGTSGTKAKHKN